MKKEIKDILDLIIDKTITIESGTDRIMNLFGVKEEFCNCGDQSSGHHYYVDERVISGWFYEKRKWSFRQNEKIV